MTKATETTKRVPAVTTEYNDETGVLAVKFADGEEFTITIADLSPEIVQRATIHGLNAKLVDAAAISRNTDTGASATVEDKKAAVIEVAERLVNGEWNKRRDTKADEGTILFQAMMRAFPNAGEEAIRSRIAAFTPEQAKAVRVNPKVAGHIAAIMAERAARAGINSDDLLDDLT